MLASYGWISRLERLTKVFDGGVTAVDDVSLRIGDGEFVVLVGPSGCGKSTLLRMIAGLEDVTAGTIRRRRCGRHGSIWRRASGTVAMVFQTYALYPHMSVRQNIGYGLKVRRTPKAEARRRVDEVAELLGLGDLLERKPAHLSGGQRQRVAMGRAIVREPKAFLMDEPLSNLDAKLRVGMRASLAQLHGRLGVTTVYVTHDQTEAMTLGQRVAVMRDGRILQADTPQRLYREPADVFVAGFIGTPAMNIVEARVTEGEISFGRYSVPLDPARRPPAGVEHVVLGIRPEAFEEATFARPGLPTLDATVTVLEELGADAYVFFRADAAAPEAPMRPPGRPCSPDDGALFTARVDPRTRARVGDDVRLAVDPARFYFFDPETGKSLVPATAATTGPVAELAPAVS